MDDENGSIDIILETLSFSQTCDFCWTEVEVDNFFTECVNHQYVFYYTECLMIQVCIMLLERQLLKK
jgi:hypothetical protein